VTPLNPMSLGIRQLFSAVAIAILSSVLVFSQTTQTGAKGKVTGPRGESLAGVTVTARRDGRDIASGKTDKKGIFVLKLKDGGKYNFVFEKAGYSGGVKYDVEIILGETRDLGDRLILEMDNGALVLIRGSVFTAEGRSVSNAEVDMYLVSSDGGQKKLGSASTNYTGEFSFRRPSGEAKLNFVVSSEGRVGEKSLDVSSPGIYRLAISVVKSK